MGRLDRFWRTALPHRAPQASHRLKVRRGAGVVAAFAVLIGLGVGIPAQPALAAAASCSYGDQAGGLYKGSICWIDMSTYSSALARSAAGQPMEVDLGGGYTATFILRDTSFGAPLRNIVPTALPIGSVPGAGPLLGGDNYAGTTGLPALYLATGFANAGNRLTLDSIAVTGPSGSPVTDFAFVGADAETLTQSEALYWRSDVPITVIDHAPVAQNATGCPVPAPGDGTTTITCAAQPAGVDVAVATVVQAVGPTQFTQTMTEGFRGSRQAVAFGIMTAKIALEKEVAGRIAPSDSFGTSIRDAQNALIGSASTGTNDTSTTGSSVVIPDPSGSGVTLAETAESGSLDNYAAAWTCTNALAGSTTVLPSGGGPQKTVAPKPGDDITCRIVNTPNSYTVAKTVSTTSGVRGDVLRYFVTVTNTGLGDYTATNPASFTDDLSDVLDDATYNGDATQGATASGTTLSWSGPLAAGQSITIEYSVTATATATGDLIARNAVTPTSIGGSCDPAAVCSVTTTLTRPVTPTPGPRVSTGGETTGPSGYPEAVLVLAGSILLIGLVLHRRRPHRMR